MKLVPWCTQTTRDNKQTFSAEFQITSNKCKQRGNTIEGRRRHIYSNLNPGREESAVYYVTVNGIQAGEASLLLAGPGPERRKIYKLRERQLVPHEIKPRRKTMLRRMLQSLLSKIVHLYELFTRRIRNCPWLLSLTALLSDTLTTGESIYIFGHYLFMKSSKISFNRVYRIGMLFCIFVAYIILHSQFRFRLHVQRRTFLNFQ